MTATSDLIQQKTQRPASEDLLSEKALLPPPPSHSLPIPLHRMEADKGRTDCGNDSGTSACRT